MADPFIDQQFVPGTVITSPWLNGINDSVKALLSRTFDLTVTNIAALRLVDPTTSQTVRTQGYYTAGDHGDGVYWYDASDTTSTDNGGTVIVGLSNSRWKLLYDGSVTIRQFGAKVDGTTDDLARIQAAWSSGVKCIIHNDGDAAISGTLVPPLNTLDVVFQRNARIIPLANNITAVKSTVSAYYVRFLSPHFDGNGKTGFVGMDMTNMRLFGSLFNPKFHNMDTGFIGRNGCFGLQIINPVAEACKNPMDMRANNSSTVIDTPQFDNGSGVGGAGDGIGVQIASGGSNLGTTIRGGYIQGFSKGVTDSGYGTTVSEVYFENCALADIHGIGAFQSRYENNNHWGNVGIQAYLLSGTDSCSIINPTMGSGARSTGLMNVDNTNANFNYFVNGSNAGLNTPFGILSATIGAANQGGRTVQSFTPLIAGSSTVGTGTYTVQAGQISLQGGQIDVNLSIGWTAHTGTGTMVIRGIPAGFAPPASSFRRIGQVILVQPITYVGPVIYAYFNGTGTDISVIQVSTSGVESPIAVPGGGGTLHLKISYNANA